MGGGVFGQYRVTDVLGEGGMGVVYAAEHMLLGRPAAVKLLLPELSRKQEIVQRFFNEARAATSIRHPGIVEIYDFGWTNEGAGFIVMELLQGETLRTRRKKGRMPWPAALAVTRQIAGALGAAHAKGIVHRDLKPDNIFLVPDPEVPGGERIKLLDFGIAKLADSSAGQHKTRTGAVIGTPTYMAPEQCRGVEVDSRADLYALGCILFELCSGRPPFVGEGEGDVLAAHIHVPPPILGTLIDGIPKQVEALLQRLLAKAPPDRVQTADEVIQLIDVASTAAQGSHASAAPSAPQAIAPAHASQVAPVRSSWRRVLLSATAAGAVMLVIVIELTAGGVTDAGPGSPPSHPPALAFGESTPPAPTPTAPGPPSSSSPVTSPAPSAPESPASAASPPSAEKEPSRIKGSPSKEVLSPSSPASTPAKRKDALAAPSTIAVTSKQRRQASEPPPPATVDVVITSSPSGAEVVSAGSVIGVTPFRSLFPRAALAVRFVLQLRGHAAKPILVYTATSSKQHVQLEPALPSAPSSLQPSQPRGVNPF
jgi:eukaryotic-like serine/threonine-protein kinase